MIQKTYLKENKKFKNTIRTTEDEQRQKNQCVSLRAGKTVNRSYE